jgi:hypothetical protein
MTEQYIKLINGESVVMTSEEIIQRQQEEAMPRPPLSLAEQLDFIFLELPPESQADFSPFKAAVKLELEQNRNNIAQLIIQRANIPPGLESFRQSMLAIFPETEI